MILKKQKKQNKQKHRMMLKKQKKQKKQKKLPETEKNGVLFNNAFKKNIYIIIINDNYI
jgi:hypothetical protein